MSILTWRDVAAPDFTSAMQGRGLAANAMNDAFASLQGALAGAKDAQATAADRAIEQRLLIHQNPDDLKAALMNGSIVGPDGMHAHLATLTDLNKQVGDLLQNAATTAGTRNINADAAGQEQTNTQKAIETGRANTDYANIQTANPVVNALVQKYTRIGSSGGPGALADMVPAAIAELEAHPDVAKLRPDQIAALRGQLTSSLSAPVDASTSLYKSIDEGLNVRATDAARSAVDEMSKHSTRRADYVTGLNNIQDPRTRTIAASMLKERGIDVQAPMLDSFNLTGNIFGPAGMAMGGSNSPSGAGLDHPILAADSTAANSYYGAPAGVRGNNTMTPDPMAPENGGKPVSQMTYGESLNFGEKMKDSTKGKIGMGDEGTSAQGVFQITNQNLNKYGPTLLDPIAKQQGFKSWKEMPRTPQTDIVMAKAIWNDAQKNGTDISKVWTSLQKDPQLAAQVQKLPWENAAPIIAQAENNGIAAAQNLATGNSMVDRQTSSTESNLLSGMQHGQVTKSLFNNFEKVWADNRDPGAIAADLIKEEPQLSNANVGEVASQIRKGQQWLSQKTGTTVPYAVAAQAYRNSLLKSEHPTYENTLLASQYLGADVPTGIYHVGKTKDDSGYYADPTTYARNLQEMMSEQGAKQAVASVTTANKTEMLNRAQDFYNQQVQQYTMLLPFKDSSPEYRAAFEKAANGVDVARQTLQQFQRQTAKTPDKPNISPGNGGEKLGPASNWMDWILATPPK